MGADPRPGVEAGSESCCVLELTEGLRRQKFENQALDETAGLSESTGPLQMGENTQQQVLVKTKEDNRDRLRSHGVAVECTPPQMLQY